MALALVVVACLPEDEDRTLEATPAAEPGGTLTVAIDEPIAIDPAIAGGRAGELVARTMCDPLIATDPATGELTPALAESWQVADSGKRLIVNLREDVHFPTGDEVTAEDVVYSLSRVVRPATASPLSELLEPIDGYDQVREADPTVKARFRDTLRGVRAIERHSLEITLKREQADAVRLLTHPLATPVPREAVESDPEAFERQPVCVGPYQPAQPWDRDDAEIVLDRVDGYDGGNEAASRRGGGYADRIVFKIHSDREAAREAFAGGEVDLAGVAGAREGDAEPARGTRVEAADGRLDYIGLPVTRPPFDTRAVRVALSQALDRRALAEVGAARLPATAVLPPTVGPAHRDHACPANVPLDGDVDAARATLADADVDLGKDQLTLAFNDDFDHRDVMAAVAKQWEQAFDVDVALQPREWNDYIAQATSPQGLTTPFRMSWAADYPSADRYLDPLLAASNIGVSNLTRFNHQPFDRQLDREARRAPVAADRHDAYQRLEDQACGQMPLVPLGFGASTYLVADDTLDSAIDHTLDRATGQPLLRELFIR